VDGATEAPGPQHVVAALLDEMYPPSLANSLREAGHDVVAVLDIEVGLGSRSDEDVLAWAARKDRCVVTENVSDFVRLARLGVSHAGIAFVSPHRFPRTRSGLHRIYLALDTLLSAKTPTRDSIDWLREQPGDDSETT
jgi:hypothetical protein